MYNIIIENLEEYPEMLDDFKGTLKLLSDSSAMVDEIPTKYLINEYFPYLIKLILKQPPLRNYEILRGVNAFLCFWISCRIKYLGAKHNKEKEILIQLIMK